MPPWPTFWQHISGSTTFTRDLIGIVHEYLPLWDQLLARRLALQLPTRSNAREPHLLYHDGPALRLDKSDPKDEHVCRRPGCGGKCGLTEEKLRNPNPATLVVRKMLSYETQFVQHCFESSSLDGGSFGPAPVGTLVYHRRAFGAFGANGNPDGTYAEERVEQRPELAPMLRLYFEPRYARGTNEYHLNEDVAACEHWFWEDQDKRLYCSTKLIDYDTKETLNVHDIRLGCTGHNSGCQKSPSVMRFVLEIQFRAQENCAWHNSFHLQCECQTETYSMCAKRPGRNEWTDLQFHLHVFGMDFVVHNRLGQRVLCFA